MKRSWEYAIGLLLLVLLLGILFFALRIRRAKLLALKGLRNQISRDLHDDVGCNLGSISLGISNLRDVIDDPSLEEEIEDLYLVTRETSVALEDAVFFTQVGSCFR